MTLQPVNFKTPYDNLTRTTTNDPMIHNIKFWDPGIFKIHKSRGDSKPPNKTHEDNNKEMDNMLINEPITAADEEVNNQKGNVGFGGFIGFEDPVGYPLAYKTSPIDTKKTACIPRVKLYDKQQCKLGNGNKGQTSLEEDSKINEEKDAKKDRVIKDNLRSQ